MAPAKNHPGSRFIGWSERPVMEGVRGGTRSSAWKGSNRRRRRAAQRRKGEGPADPADRPRCRTTDPGRSADEIGAERVRTRQEHVRSTADMYSA